MKRTNDWVVGAVVLVTMIVVVVSTLWLQQTDLGSKRGELTARFREVGNLGVGNSVVIRGVQAGRVESIALADGGWVVVSLSIDPGVELPPDPIVLIQAATLFGEWQATIANRDGAPSTREIAGQLADTALAPPGALPGALLPDIAQLTSLAGGIAGNVSSIADRVRTAFDSAAAVELRTTVRNMSEMSTELTQTVRTQAQNLDVLSAQLRAGVSDLTAGANAFQRSLTRLDSATAGGQVAAIVGETQVAAASLREASQRLRSIALSLETSEKSLRSVIVRADTLLGRVESGQGSLGLLFNDPRLYNSSDSLLLDIRSLLADVRKNPKRYFSLSIF